jgi:hypothetical protein
MATSRPFAYNPGTGITGTTQIGDIAVGVDPYLPYASNYGGVQWWAGVDEDLGYAICRPVVSVSATTSLAFLIFAQRASSSFIVLMSMLVTQDDGQGHPA